MDDSLKRILLLSAVAGGIIVFLIWLLSVVLPITLLEITYQYKKHFAMCFMYRISADLYSRNLISIFGGFSSIHKTNGITIPALLSTRRLSLTSTQTMKKCIALLSVKGIAHASSTAFPGSGVGLGYYFAHSSAPQFVTQYNAIFYLLDKLKAGDEIYIFHDKERTDYRVTTKEFTEPTDVSF